MDPHELRRLDFTLGEELESVRDAFADFFAKEVPLERARRAEPVGFDEELWGQVVDLGATSMAMPEEFDGDGAGVVELTLLAHEVGRSLAPVPLLDHIVAARLLAASGDPAVADIVAEATAGERILGFSPRPLTGPLLVSSAAVARDIVGFDGQRLIIVRAGRDRPHVRNQASSPSAWVDPSGAEETVIEVTSAAPADRFSHAAREWKVLWGAALAGLTEAALAVGVEFVKSRETMGVPIGSLQGVAFPLTDVRTGASGATAYVRRAAWLLDNEPDAETHSAAGAFAYSASTAVHGAQVAAHVQGGLGFMADTDAALFFLRAAAWAAAGGGISREESAVGRTIIDQFQRRAG